MQETWPVARVQPKIGADVDVSRLRKLRSNLAAESNDCPQRAAVLFMERILTEKGKNFSPSAMGTRWEESVYYIHEDCILFGYFEVSISICSPLSECIKRDVGTKT